MAGFLRKVKKVGRKAVRKVLQAGVKRYTSKGGLGKITKDIRMLKHLVNVEKKHAAVTGNGAFAQSTDVLTPTAPGGVGARLITPLIAQGITAEQRNGNSVKVVSACLDIQVAQNISTVNEFRYKIFVVQRKECYTPMSTVDVAPAMFNANLFSPASVAIDYHSNRDPDTFSQFKIIKTIYGKLTSDQLASQVAYQQHKIPLKFNFHWRWGTDASTQPITNNMYLICVGDTGTDNQNTGALYRYQMRYYFTDN